MRHRLAERLRSRCAAPAACGRRRCSRCVVPCVRRSASSRARSNEPLIWTDEMSRFLMVWLAVVGWMLASRRRAHIRIRFFQDLLPTPRRRVGRDRHPVRASSLLRRAAAGYGVGLVERNHDIEAIVAADLARRGCTCRSSLAGVAHRGAGEPARSPSGAASAATTRRRRGSRR